MKISEQTEDFISPTVENTREQHCYLFCLAAISALLQPHGRVEGTREQCGRHWGYESDKKLFQGKEHSSVVNLA